MKTITGLWPLQLQLTARIKKQPQLGCNRSSWYGWWWWWCHDDWWYLVLLDDDDWWWYQNNVYLYSRTQLPSIGGRQGGHNSSNIYHFCITIAFIVIMTLMGITFEIIFSSILPPPFNLHHPDGRWECLRPAPTLAALSHSPAPLEPISTGLHPLTAEMMVM